jgi:hypothetical protein
VIELIGNSRPERTAGIFGQNMKDLFSSHDPEHIESPQGVEGIKSL